MLKRAFDVLASAFGIALTLPFLAVIAIVIRRKMGPPAIFNQKRPGLAEKPFVMYKFRTMTNERDERGRLLPDEKRLTRVGALLRKTSLDELPELINVLKGDMSLVGPRPLLTRYLPYYTEKERRRFLMRPGITGWAQIHGRNELVWDRRLAYDVWYIDHHTMMLDIYILLRTISHAISRRGVLVDPGAAMKDLDAEREGVSVQ